MWSKDDCYFGHYQQSHLQLREKSVPGQNDQRKTYSVIVWEYGGINVKASPDRKSNKPKMFQEPEN
jgi:hypothetical protein